MTFKEKIKKLFEDKKNVISISYIIAVTLGVITLGLFTLNLEKGNEYKNFYMIAFKESSSNPIYFATAMLFMYFVVTNTYSLIATTFFQRKDPKVKSNSMKYARFFELLSISITSVFAITFLVFFLLVNVLINDNISLGISILLGIFVFLSIFAGGIGDYYDEVITNIRAKEIIEERKKHAEEAKLLRDKKEEKKEETKEVNEDIKPTTNKEVKPANKKTTSNKKTTKK